MKIEIIFSYTCVLHDTGSRMASHRFEISIHYPTVIMSVNILILNAYAMILNDTIYVA